MIELKGERVVLKALDRAHCHALWERAEVDVEKPTQAFQPGLASENADKWFEEIQDKQGKSGVDFGVFDLEGEVVGHVQVHSIDWQASSGEVGFGINNAAERGKGYGTEATHLLMGYAFDHLGLHRLGADVVEYNGAAVRLLEKCGFRPEGRAREAFYFRGRWHDKLLYSLLQGEFRNVDA